MRFQQKLIATVLLSLSFFRCLAWERDSSSKLSFSGYVDAYYAYYTDSAGHGDYQKFPTVSPRSNQAGLNIAQITAQYDGEKTRGILTLHYGDIPRSAWSGTFNFIQEAHVGIRLVKKIWLDAGFFRTHFGTEGLLPKENIASSISVCTFYEPYYETGLRLNYVPNNKLSVNLYLLNGYNIYEENNSKKSFGLLVSYALGENGNLNYSNYIGDDTPDEADTISHLRVHQNLYLNYQLHKLKVQVGVDYCLQGHSSLTDPDATADMFSGLAGLKYQVRENLAVYGRGEWFSDPDGYMSGLFTDGQGKLTGLKIWGLTVGVECRPTADSYIRLEARRLQADDDQKIFRWNGENENSRMEVALNMGITIQ